LNIRAASWTIIPALVSVKQEVRKRSSAINSFVSYSIINWSPVIYELSTAAIGKHIAKVRIYLNSLMHFNTINNVN
ncbi:MAG: hypothetical protein K2K58_03085, partial [Muribaculaceae bacterium]|nr:hypothetical protein [Muribaculaceae bacterium]